MRTRVRPPLWLAAITLLALAGPASARDATLEEVRSLARSSVTDSDSLEELRAIDSVNGRPVDLEAALEGASPEELNDRLETLGSGAAGEPAAGADGATAVAREVLDGSKYRERDVPRPFEGVLDAIGDVLQPVWNWIYELADDVTGGRPELLLGLLALVVVVLAAVVARRVIQKRARAAGDEESSVDPRRGPRAAELESRADAAEREGHLEEAIRLRFKAGLVRLAEAGAIPGRASLTSEEIARYLDLRAFEEVAATFDEVVYGRRAPAPDDVDRTRRGWAAVLAARSRGS